MARVTMLANAAKRRALTTKLDSHIEGGHARKQGDIETHYTDEALKTRKQLRRDPRVVTELEKFWVSARRHHTKSSEDALDQEDYRALHGRLLEACNNSDDPHNMDEEEEETAFQEDWRSDSMGTGSVDKQRLAGTQACMVQDRRRSLLTCPFDRCNL